MNAAYEVAELGPAQIAWTDSYRVRSKTIPQDFLVEVALPPGGIPAGVELPVIFVLDGNQMFGVTASAARFIQSGPFPLPAALVVGIGYHFGSVEERVHSSVLRVRDLTPCGDPLLDEQYADRAMVTGGADAFLNFIDTELKPFLASRYPVAAQDQTLVGSSLAGLFVLHTLLTSHTSFNRYVAISPAAYWGRGRLFEVEAELARSTVDIPAHVYLAAGGLEEAHDPKQGFVSNLYRLEAALRARHYPSLNLDRRIFDGETHMSVYPGAVTLGLGTVFGGYRDMHDWSRWLNRP